MAKKKAESESLEETPVTPEISFKLNADAGDDVSVTIGSNPRQFQHGQVYHCTRAEWAALKSHSLFELEAE